MKTHLKKRRVIEPEAERPELEIPADAIEESIKVVSTKTGYVVGFLANDQYVDNPIEDQDAMGKFFCWKNGRDELLKYCEALGYDPETREQTGKANPDAVTIDKYEHSGVAYSVSGEGMNCQWDTSRAWAVWLPDKCLLDELAKLKGAPRRAKCVVYARQACELINQWFSGEVYIVSVMVFNKAGVEIDNDVCGGYFGHKWAQEELDRQIKWFKKQAGIAGRKGNK